MIHVFGILQFHDNSDQRLFETRGELFPQILIRIYVHHDQVVFAFFLYHFYRRSFFIHGCIISYSVLLLPIEQVIIRELASVNSLYNWRIDVYGGASSSLKILVCER